MSGTQAPPEDRFGASYDAFGGQAATTTAEHQMPALNSMPIGGANSAVDLAASGLITAQRVAVKRNLPAIRQDAIVASQEAGDGFFYRLPFKSKGGGTTYVEGPTVQCAMTAATLYGNCRVEAFLANETPQAFQFLARFSDLERGVTITRAFWQRKGMNTGMRDAERQQEIIFSIGQSKAMRNVVVAALGWLTELMEKEAKKGILSRIENNPNGARDHIIKICNELDIPLARVERSVARKAADWLAPDMARLLGQIASVRDGFALASDLFPEPGAEEAEAATAEVAQAKTMATDAAKPAATRKPRQAKEQAPSPSGTGGEAEAAGAPEREVEAAAVVTPVPSPGARLPEEPTPEQLAGAGGEWDGDMTIDEGDEPEPPAIRKPDLGGLDFV